MAMKTSAMSIPQKWMNQPRSRVGKNALLVGRVWRFTLRICPMYTNPVKKMIVKGVP